MTSTFRNIHFQCHQISANLCDMQRTQWPLTVRRKDVKKVKEQTWGIQPHLTNLGIISTFVLLKTKVKLSNYTARFALKLSWSLTTATNRRERKITQSSFMIAVVVRALLKSTANWWADWQRADLSLWSDTRQGSPSVIFIWSIMLYVTDVTFHIRNVPGTEEKTTIDPLWNKHL